MQTNYEMLAVLGDNMGGFTSTTSLVPLQFERDNLNLGPSLSSRLRALGRLPRLAFYFLVLSFGTIAMAFVLTLFLDIKTSPPRGTMTMDNVFDGSLSPRMRVIRWLPQCKFRPSLPPQKPECHATRGRRCVRNR